MRIRLKTHCPQCGLVTHEYGFHNGTGSATYYDCDAMTQVCKFTFGLTTTAYYKQFFKDD